MALSNAERQKRYRERLKAAVRQAGGDSFLEKLNRAFREGETEAMQQALDRIASRPVDDEVTAAWSAWEKAARNMPSSEGWQPDQWISHARETGAKLGEYLVTQAYRDCLGPLAAERREAREAQKAEEEAARRKNRGRRYAAAFGTGPVVDNDTGTRSRHRPKKNTIDLNPPSLRND